MTALLDEPLLVRGASGDESSDLHGLDEQVFARGSDIWERFKFEFKWENLSFSGDYPNTYGRLHWPRAFGTAGSGCWCCSRARGDEFNAHFPPVNPRIWLAWRAVVFCYMTGVMIWSAQDQWYGGRWFDYLTNWQAVMFAVYSWLALLSTVYVQKYHWDAVVGDFDETAASIGASTGSSTEYKMPMMLKITWFFFGLGVTAGLWVTLLFWFNAAVFGYYDPAQLPIQIVSHGSTFIVIILDFSLNALPWQLFQFVWPALVALIYALWTVIFYAAGMVNTIDGKRYIYMVFDWAHPLRTSLLVVAVIVVGMPMVSTLIWLLSSEQVVGKCAAWRIVPWVDCDGKGVFSFSSFRQKKKKMRSSRSAGVPG